MENSASTPRLDRNTVSDNLTGKTGFPEALGSILARLHLDPAEVSLLLNQYFRRMTDIIFDYNGTLDKYIGDAIIVGHHIHFEPVFRITSYRFIYHNIIF